MIRRWLLGVIILLLVGCSSEPQTLLDASSPAYLPLIMGSYVPKVGTEFAGVICPFIDEIHPNAPLKISIRWSDVEQTQGTYDWSSIDDKLCGKTPTWISIKTTPEWAVKIGRPICKLPRGEYYQEAAEFYQAAIDRYQPKQVGIWNEPDIYYELMNPEHVSYYGCLGGEAEEYGEFVKYVYENVSGADIIIGEVANPHWNFLERAIETADNSFDGVSFHCYPQFRDGFTPGKCIEKYNLVIPLTEKPIYNSEVGLYYVTGDEDDYYDAQIELFKELLGLPIQSYWYTGGYNGWPTTISTDLLNKDSSPRPVWYWYMNQ